MFKQQMNIYKKYNDLNSPTKVQAKQDEPLPLYSVICQKIKQTQI